MKSSTLVSLLCGCLLAALPVSAVAQIQDTHAETLASYRSMVEKYRAGDNVTALKELLVHEDRAWFQEAVDGLAEAPDLSIGELQAAALMHTEVLLARWLPSFNAGLHLAIARGLVDFPAASTEPGGFRLPDEFRKQWHLAIAWALQGEMQVNTLIEHLQTTIARYPDDPDVLLAQGSFYELFAWSEKLPARPAAPAPLVLTPETRTRSGVLREAERVFRAALTASPNLDEARLRLGRVLDELDRPDEALELLKPLTEDDTGPIFKYLALLFTGAAEQHAGRLERAATAYQFAASINPRCQTPVLALSVVRRAQGSRDVAYDMVQSATGDVSACRDPWWHYKFGQAPWRLDNLLDEMRREIPAMNARACLTLLLMAAGPAMVSAQQPVFRANVSLVRVDVLAADRGKPIVNLKAQDFEVLDNGVSQSIDAVFGDSESLDVLFVFDRSGSVAGETLGRLAEAARAVLEQLEPDDRAGLLAFNHRFSLSAPLTTDRAAVRRAIDDVGPGGATSLRDTLYVAFTLAQNSSRRTLVLVFTDGLDSNSWLSAAEVLDFARQSDVVVYAVPFRQPEESLLGEVADATGGRMVLADSPDRLKRVFLDVLVEMRSRYLLTFTPSGAEAPGWHTLSVRLKNRNGRITARAGYFVSRPSAPDVP